jgi:hypothetical protein
MHRAPSHFLQHSLFIACLWITCQVLHGKFAVLDLPELPQGRKWLIVYDDLENGFDLDRDRRADVTLRVVPPDYQRDE